MNEKPKRDQNPPALDFVTALTPPECVERLKEAAFNTIEQRLSIRATEHKFVVEMPGIRYPRSITSTIRCHGFFTRTAQGTRVTAYSTEVGQPWSYRQPYSSLLMIGVALLIIMVIYDQEKDIGWGASLFLGVFMTVIYVGGYFYQAQKTAKAEALKQYLWQLIYELLSKP